MYGLTGGQKNIETVPPNATVIFLTIYTSQLSDLKYSNIKFSTQLFKKNHKKIQTLFQ